MTITGLEGTSYYLFNPIWVDVVDAPNKVRFNVKINGESNFFDLYPFQGELRFDIGKLVLGLIPNVTNKTTLIGQMDGAYEVELKIGMFILDGGQSGSGITQKKYFILGGVKSYSSNVIAKTNLNLHKYYWAGFPTWNSILSSGKVMNLNMLDPERYNFKQLIPRVNCTNAFFGFRNKLGGFSPYLFEDFNIIDDNKDKGYYLTPYEPKISGIESTLSISVRSKVKREFYETINSLADSYEIYLYNSDRLIDTDDDWVRLVGSNSISINDKNISTDIELKFDVVTNLLKVW